MRIFILFILFTVIGTVKGQTPGGGTRPAATAAPVPPGYTAPLNNYIRKWQPVMPATDAAVVTAPARTTGEVRQSTSYFDGLGRPLQNVTKGISNSGKDLVDPVVYDAFGREQYKYLPYVQQDGNSSDGQLKLTPFSAQASFYQNGTLNPGTQGESVFYSQSEYEHSPLNRVLKTYAPGNSWAKEGGQKAVSYQYGFNTAAEVIRKWIISPDADIPDLSIYFYEAPQLYKTAVIDEAGNQVLEYKDKEGRIILRKVQEASAPGVDHSGWLCTYYVYDYMGNLRFIIPPQAVRLMQTSDVYNWNVAPYADELCYQYKYDERNRMIIKKVPGAGPVYLIYDTRDRLVFTQDANQRLKSPQEWLVTFYDGLNRPTMTAIYKATTTRAALQASLNTATSATQSISYVFPGIADLVLGSYDGSNNYTATNTVTFQDGFDSGAGAEFIAEINAAATGGTTTINATNSLPSISSAALTPLTYTFYDNYNYAGALSYETGDLAKLEAGVNPYAEALPAAPGTMTTGIVTGTKVRVLDTDQWRTTTIYYNDKGHVIQTASNNSAGGKDVSTNLYDFSGKVLSNYLRHTNLRSGQTPKITVQTMMEYDAAGRVLNVKKRLNDDSNLDKIIVANSYDELSQLKQKRLGVTGASSQLDILNYTYNIQGWLQGINITFVNSTNTTNWFGQELSYDYGFTTNQYNGNIAGAKWKSKSDGIARAYGYSYDKINRLTGANFTQQNTTGATWTQNNMDFSVSNLSYDANGNIKTQTQKGMIGTVINTIDQLTYSYPTTGSNKLSAVSDGVNTASARLGDFNNGSNTGDDYSYDANGNLVTDQNKGISAITYNHLNLPANIVITGKGNITYQYDAAGNKLKKTVTDNTVSPARTIVTDYIGGFIYEQDKLQYVSHEEGRIRPVYRTGQPVSFSYDYFEKDHLGNTRVVLTDQTDFTMYTATMETAAAATETALFNNVDATRTEKPAGYPEDKTTDKNAFVAKLNAKAGGNKIGPSLVLRVMAGDTVKINARAFYKSMGPKDKARQHPADEMVAGLLQAFGGHTADDTHGAVADNRTPLNNNFYNGDYQRLKEKDPDGIAPDRPKAYLNFVLFDDQFKLVNENSGVRQVKSAPDELQELGIDQMVAATSGFLYVYTSNEAEQDVFFDNVVVAVNSGPLLEETHYYPFGLTMAGISSNALKGPNYPENRKKFNAIEFTDELDLNIYDTQLRNLDPQTGRWNQIDPKPNYAMSPYAAMANNPLLYADPIGDTTWTFGTVGQYLGFVPDKLDNQVHFMDNNDPNTPAYDASKLSLKEANKLGRAMRNASVAFMGSKTASDLNMIVKQADKILKELAFIGTIGKDKEIRLTALPVDKSNTRDEVNVPNQIDKKYSTEEQTSLFLAGHVHGKAAAQSAFYPTLRENLNFLGVPTYPNDYQPALFRSANASEKGQSPALIATPYGVTVYGTGTTSTLTGGGVIVEGAVVPNKPNGYLLYRYLKSR